MKQRQLFLPIFILLLLTVIFLVSCSENNSVSNSETDPVVGVWRLNRITYTSDQLTVYPSELGFTQGMVLGSSGTFTMSHSSDFELINSSGTWITEDNILRFTFETGPDEYVGQTISSPYTFNIAGEMELTSSWDRNGTDEPATLIYRRL